MIICKNHRYPNCGPPPPLFFLFFNSSLLWDVFIINSVKKLQTWPKTQSEIDISPFLKTQKPSILYSILIKRLVCFCTLELYTKIIYENKIKNYTERSMIWPQNVDKGKLNKYILKATVDPVFRLSHCNWNFKI